MAKENKDIHILVVDDDMAVLHSARLLLKEVYGRVNTERDPRRIPFILQEQEPDLVLLDLNFRPGDFDGKEGLSWLDEIIKRKPETAVILFTAYGDLNLAVEGMKRGAADFITKPWVNEKLLVTIANVLRLKESEALAGRLREANHAIVGNQTAQQLLIGNSAAMVEVHKMIQKVAVTDANVLILGENGTGKELVARALHEHSLRKKEVFMHVDLGALSGTLFESELFGYTKGAFTDAREDRAGRFELAQGGTVFLDEIGNLDINLQAKLLTVLQRRQVNRLGSAKVLDLDIRLVCATNQHPAEMLSEGTFRQDLLYRINTVEITLPPLRQRREDIPLLVNHFLQYYCRKYQKPLLQISGATMEGLCTADWPGNVRELQHATERAVILSEQEELSPEDFLLSKRPSGNSTDARSTFDLAENEKSLIMEAIAANQGNITAAAKALGIDRQALYRRMHKYGI